MRVFGFAAAFLAFSACASAQPAAPATPDWWRAHVTFMEGTWQTPNPGGENDPAVPDAFGMEWRTVNEGHGLIGRLYGVEAGREIAEYWSFREFWHPGENRVVVQQWGGPGVFGAGETTSLGPDRGQLDQTFWLADGRSWREGHRTEERGDVYVTEVYDIDAAGAWTLRSTNTWRRVAGE